MCVCVCVCVCALLYVYVCVCFSLCASNYAGFIVGIELNYVNFNSVDCVMISVADIN